MEKNIGQTDRIIRMLDGVVVDQSHPEVIAHVRQTHAA